MNFAQNQAPDPEWDAFIAGNTSGGGGIMLFGRITYQMMAAFWPTPEAVAAMPVVANTMNNARKVVFSRTLQSVSHNSRLVRDDLPGLIAGAHRNVGLGHKFLRHIERCKILVLLGRHGGLKWPRPVGRLQKPAQRARTIRPGAARETPPGRGQ